MSNRPISLQDFKKWLSEEKDLGDFFNIGREEEDPNEKFIGKGAHTKVSEQKLLEKVLTDDDAETLIREFIEDGGTVLSIEGKKIQIEVESGTFYIPRFCVKIRKS